MFGRACCCYCKITPYKKAFFPRRLFRAKKAKQRTTNRTHTKRFLFHVKRYTHPKKASAFNCIKSVYLYMLKHIFTKVKNAFYVIFFVAKLVYIIKNDYLCICESVCM